MEWGGRGEAEGGVGPYPFGGCRSYPLGGMDRGGGEKVDERAEREVEGGMRSFPFGGCRLNPLRGVDGNGGDSGGAGRRMGGGTLAGTQ